MLPIISGLIVSVDAFFIGISMGLQEKCKFWHLAVINAFLLILCLLGFFIAESIYEIIPFDPDLVVGISFITLGVWYIIGHFLSEKKKKNNENFDNVKSAKRTITIVGLIMSLEAMLITMGITFVFLPDSNILIPLTVAAAHFVYCTITFFLVRVDTIKKMPVMLSHIISGSGLIIYGLLALFI